MWKTIVWATDGSDGAELAREEAAQLARATGARLVVAHHDQRYLGRTGGLPIFLGESERLTRIRGDVDELERSGHAVELVVRAGSRDPSEIVAEIAEEVDADLVVCGSRGQSALAGALVGSVAHRLLHVAPCPVLVVSEHALRHRDRELAPAGGLPA
jgi:nucleotide-binding universal stress UspA family protein